MSRQTPPEVDTARQLPIAEVTGHFLGEPGACDEPISLHRLGRHAERRGGLVEGESRKKATLYDVRAAWIDRSESLERFIERHKFLRLLHREELGDVIERDRLGAGAAFGAQSSPCTVHQHTSHGGGRRAKELGPLEAVERMLLRESQIGLIHETGGGERMPGPFPAQVGVRERAQVIVQLDDPHVGGTGRSCGHRRDKSTGPCGLGERETASIPSQCPNRTPGGAIGREPRAVRGNPCHGVTRMSGNSLSTVRRRTRRLIGLTTAGLVAGACGSESPPTEQAPVCAKPSPSISQFAAAPSAMLTGQSSTLSWTVTGADGVSMSPDVGTLSGSSVTVRPTATASYTLTAVNCAGSSTAQVTVTVAQPALYQTPDVYVPAAPIDGLVATAQYGVGVNAYTRSIPILIRYPAGATTKRPMIIWSHGGGMQEFGKYQNDDWGNLLVRAGYVVVHMSHMPRTETEFDLLAREFNLNRDSLWLSVPEVAASLDRPRDVISVLNALLALDQSNTQFANRVDFTRVALAGWSRGAYTARTTNCARISVASNLQRYSFRDTTKSTNHPLRVGIKAVLANSPQGPDRMGFYDNGGGDHSWSNCTGPDLAQTASGDNTDTPSANRVIPFSLMPAGNKFLMFINDPATSHSTFNLEDAATSPQFSQWITSTALAFLDGYVKELPAARAYLATQNLSMVSAGKASLQGR